MLSSLPPAASIPNFTAFKSKPIAERPQGVHMISGGEIREMEPDRAHRVLVGIPTTDCGSYIANSLRMLRPELADLASGYEVTLLVCLNGGSEEERRRDRDAIEEGFKAIAADGLSLKAEIIERPAAGKNAAVNAIVAEARARAVTYIHLLDDDIQLRHGSLRRNVAALQGCPVSPALSGSRYIAYRRSLTEFLRRERSVRRGIVAWWWHSVFRTPFEPDEEPYIFCSAQSMAMRASEFPALPEDDAVVTDDAFINYSVVQGNGALMHPDDSIVYFEVASRYDEWIRQQQRIWVGVENALKLFRESEKEIYSRLSWAYAHNREARVRARLRSPRHAILLACYRLAQAHLGRVHARTVVFEWGRAATTKGMGHGAYAGD
jgi:hypothetical protein